MRQQGVLRGVLDTNNDLCRNVETLKCELQSHVKANMFSVIETA